MVWDRNLLALLFTTRKPKCYPSWLRVAAEMSEHPTPQGDRVEFGLESVVATRLEKMRLKRMCTC